MVDGNHSSRKKLQSSPPVPGTGLHSRLLEAGGWFDLANPSRGSWCQALDTGQRAARVCRENHCRFSPLHFAVLEHGSSESPENSWGAAQLQHYPVSRGPSSQGFTFRGGGLGVPPFQDRIPVTAGWVWRSNGRITEVRQKFFSAS